MKESKMAAQIFEKQHKKYHTEYILQTVLQIVIAIVFDVFIMIIITANIFIDCLISVPMLQETHHEMR